MTTSLLIAQQTQYLHAYALIAVIVLLGFLVVCMPRPRKTFYGSAEERAEAENPKRKPARSKKKKSKKKKKKKKRK